MGGEREQTIRQSIQTGKKNEISVVIKLNHKAKGLKQYDLSLYGFLSYVKSKSNSLSWQTKARTVRGLQCVLCHLLLPFSHSPLFLAFKHPDLPPLALHRNSFLSAAGMAGPSDLQASDKSLSQQSLPCPPHIPWGSLHALLGHSVSAFNFSVDLLDLLPESPCPELSSVLLTAKKKKSLHSVKIVAQQARH